MVYILRGACLGRAGMLDRFSQGQARGRELRVNDAEAWQRVYQAGIWF